MQKVAELSGQPVDWSFTGGRNVIQALGDLSQVFIAMCNLFPECLDALNRGSEKYGFSDVYNWRYSIQYINWQYVNTPNQYSNITSAAIRLATLLHVRISDRRLAGANPPITPELQRSLDTLQTIVNAMDDGEYMYYRTTYVQRGWQDFPKKPNTPE